MQSHLKWEHNLICCVNWLRNTYFSVTPTPPPPSPNGPPATCQIYPQSLFPDVIIYKLSTCNNILSTAGFNEVMWHKTQPEAYWANKVGEKRKSLLDTSVKTTQLLVPLQIKRGIQCRAIKFIPHKPPRHESHLTLSPTEEIFIFPGSFTGIF